jgi:hypothetical protein
MLYTKHTLNQYDLKASEQKMKTALFSPLYLEGLDPSQSCRMLRNKKYVDYYVNLKTKGYLNFDEIWLADNASGIDKIHEFLDYCPSYVNVFRFDENLVHGPNPNDYPYCWRAIYFLQDLIGMGFRKMLCIDSDSFIVSDRLAKYVTSLKSGCVTFWSEKYQFPTAECYVLCEDFFREFIQYCQTPWEKRVGSLLEVEMPWSYINKDFNCDRYGEKDEPQADSIDGYFQSKTSRQIIFRI